MLNSISLAGRLTADPELKTLSNGNAALNFCLAVQRDYKNANGEYDTDFINCCAFGKTAEFAAKYFNKGSFMILSGRLQIRKYTANDGTKRTAAEIIVNNITYVGGTASGNTNNAAQQSAPQGFTYDASDEDLPF